MSIGPLEQRRVGAFDTNDKDLLYSSIVSCAGNLIEIEEEKRREIDIVDVCRKMERLVGFLKRDMSHATQNPTYPKPPFQ